MKNGAKGLLSALLIFIGILIGMLIGRTTMGKSINIAYESGTLDATYSTSPVDYIAATSPAKPNVGMVNINTATVSKLMSLPGIGQTLAQRIVDYREEHGSFKTIDDLKLVEGIGDSKFNELKDDITVGG